MLFRSVGASATDIASLSPAHSDAPAGVALPLGTPDDAPSPAPEPFRGQRPIAMRSRMPGHCRGERPWASVRPSSALWATCSQRHHPVRPSRPTSALAHRRERRRIPSAPIHPSRPPPRKLALLRPQTRLQKEPPRGGEGGAGLEQGVGGESGLRVLGGRAGGEGLFEDAARSRMQLETVTSSSS